MPQRVRTGDHMTQKAEDDATRPKAASSASTGRQRRLIEEWLPIAEIGIESLRERTPMTPFPAPNRLHVWWARRPLVASRAAILASLLPQDADQQKFLHLLGIHGDPVESRRRIDKAKQTGERFAGEAYSYPRAFKHLPSLGDIRWLDQALGPRGTIRVLDPTAGGGSIPFEALRLGCDTFANDLNAVAWLILRATVEFPAKLGSALASRFRHLAAVYVERRDVKLTPFFPKEPSDDSEATNWIWARTITCPYCGGLVPLSPNWKLNNKGVGVRLIPQTDHPANRRCEFGIVHKVEDQSAGTVKGGDGLCPFPDCTRVIDGDEIKAQAQAGNMGEQLYAVVYTERQLTGYAKTGKPKYRKARGFRAPRPKDDVSEQVLKALAEKMPEWQARDIVPDEEFPTNTNDDRPRQYGMPLWRDMFSPRQLLGHCTSVEVFRELLQECGGGGNASDLDAAALTYIALALDKMLNYNARMVRWHANREVVAGVFDRHDFSFKWSYAEMAPTIAGLGYHQANRKSPRRVDRTCRW